MECDRDGDCDNYRCQDITCTPARSILLLLSPCGYAQLVVRSYLTYTKGRANQWTECPACTFIRQCIEEVSNTKRFHASLGSLPPTEFAETCSSTNPSSDTGLVGGVHSRSS